MSSITTIDAQNEQDTTTIEGIKKLIRQSTYYDSLKVFYFGAKAIKMAQDKKSLIDEATIYQYYGNFCHFSKNNLEATKFYNKSIDLSQKAGDGALANATKIRLNFILVDENMLQAEKGFNELLEEAEKNNYVVNKIECLNGLGIIYEQRQMYDKSLDYYLKALKIAEQNKIEYHQAMLLNNIGLVKLFSKQHDAAKSDFEKAVELANRLGELRLALNLHNNLGVVTSELNDYESATLHYHQTLKNAHQLGFPTAIGVAHLNLANSYYKLNNKKNAFIHVDSSIYIFKLYDEKYFVSQTFLLKAKVFLDSNMLKESRTYIDSAMIYAIAIESLSDELEAIKVEASLLAKQGNYKKAYEKHILYHQMSDSLLTVNNKDKVAQLQVLFGKEQLESQLETEQMKVLISHEQLEKERNEKKYQEIRTYYILTILVIVFLVIAVLIYLRYVIITRKQQQFFSQNLIVNIDEERSRISKDLHDDVGQLLSSIKMKVNMYNSNQIDSLKGLENEIGEVIEQTRSLSHTLHPSYIEKIGLKRSLASLIDRTQQNTGKVCSFEWDVDIEDYSINKRTQIFRIIQECINNTIKHSQASALKVVAHSQGQNVLITYRDNGIGFGNLASINSGIGLKTIEERAKKMDAKLSIESTKGKGFKLTLKL